VAVRVLSRATTAGAGRLLQNARALTALSHPNVITLFDIGEDDGAAYIVFEFVKGESLRAHMAGRPVNVRKAIELAVQIADAVADAHAAGFLHSGLSPDAVLVTAKGHAKIPSFELAAYGGMDEASSEPRLRDYDSPEEASGGEVDERSDVYSVGAILYEMLTARRPMHRGASAPSASNANVPPELDRVVLQAVAPNPELRYRSLVSLTAELRAVLSALDARTAVADERARPAASTSVSQVVVMTLVILLIVAALAWWLTRS
jgi:serine/threonine-protein kinase